MTDVLIRKSGHAGRITLNRAHALNAVTYDMCAAIEAALDNWRTDDDIALVIIDAKGDRAFSAGGDISDMYATASVGDFEFGRKYWADEYRLNEKIFNFPKPYVAFMQGFTMGGGVGLSCHGSHRIVADASRIAMPECSIGLVPDVGGSLILARAPGRLGEYLGTTGARMAPGDAIHAGFADYFIAQDQWPDLIIDLDKNGDISAIDRAATPPPASPLADIQGQIDSHFGGETIGDIMRSLAHTPDDFTRATQAMLSRQSPLSLACTVEMIHRTRGADSIARALDLEYRFTYRSAEKGDFVEGIRAAIIDKDHTAKWRHASIDAVRPFEVSQMLMPLGANALKL